MNFLLLGGFANGMLGFLMAFLSLFLIMLILIQRGKGGGLTGALGGPGGQSAFGSKAGDTFTVVTVIVASIWGFTCAFAMWLNVDSGDDSFDLDAEKTVAADGVGNGVTLSDLENENSGDSSNLTQGGLLGTAESDEAVSTDAGEAGTSEEKPPATEPPATEPPATEPPATEPPATEPPATEPPATEPPATEPPATEPPATEPPATEPPATETSAPADKPAATGTDKAAESSEKN